jgi:hypothetical protein
LREVVLEACGRDIGWPAASPSYEAEQGRVLQNLHAAAVNYGVIDALAPRCFDALKARLIKRRWFNGGCFMRGGKYYFYVAKASPKFESQIA